MKFLTSFVITLFGQGVVLVVGFLNAVLITRQLGRAGRGEYAMVSFLVMALGVLFGEGIHRTNIYFTSKDKSQQNVSALFSNAIVLFGVITVVFAGFSLLPDAIFQLILPGIKRLYIQLGILIALFFIFGRMLQGIFLGLQQFWHYNFAYIGPIVLFFFFDVAYFCVMKHLTTTVVLINYSLAMFVIAVMALLVLIKPWHTPLMIRFRPDWNALKLNLNIGGRATIAYLLLFLLARINLYIVNYTQPLEQVGLFAVAANIGSLIQRVPNVTGVVLFPRVSETEGKKQMKLTLKASALAFSIGLFVSAFFLIWGKQIIIFLYKPEFAESYRALVWLLPGIVVLGIAIIFNTSLWGRGFPAVTLWAPFVAVVTNILFCFILIPSHGIVGASQASSISFFLFSLIIATYYFRKHATS